MALVITINFVNRSSDAGNSDVVIFAAPPGGPPLRALRFHNKSGSLQTFVCFQPPEGVTSGLVPAWLALPVANGVEVNFTWQETYDLVWVETGSLAPGVQVTASEVVPAVPGVSDQIKLIYTDGAFSFTGQRPGAPRGQLQIIAEAVPPNTVSVGIGMAGSPTRLVQAFPFITNVFAPSVNYWVTIADVTQGEVMDISKLASKAQVVFPPQVTAMTVTLNADHSWTVQQGLAV
jgi:rhizosphere induced protein